VEQSTAVIIVLSMPTTKTGMSMNCNCF